MNKIVLSFILPKIFFYYKGILYFIVIQEATQIVQFICWLSNRLYAKYPQILFV